MGFSEEIHSESKMRLFNIIRENIPPYSTGCKGLCAPKAELSSLISCHWRSSHHLVPLLEQHAFEPMVNMFLEEYKDTDVVSAETFDGVAALRALVFAVAALSARYNAGKDKAEFYYHLASTAISVAENTASYEFLLATTFLVCELPTPYTYIHANIAL